MLHLFSMFKQTSFSRRSCFAITFLQIYFMAQSVHSGHCLTWPLLGRLLLTVLKVTPLHTVPLLQYCFIIFQNLKEHLLMIGIHILFIICYLLPSFPKAIQYGLRSKLWLLCHYYYPAPRMVPGLEQSFNNDFWMIKNGELIKYMPWFPG